MSFTWSSRPRNYQVQLASLKRDAEEVVDHPLKPMTITIQESVVKRKTGGSSAQNTPRKTTTDPLSTVLEGLDPLSQFAAENPLRLAPTTTRKDSLSKSSLDDGFEPWTAKKAAILSKYTTCEKLSLIISNLNALDKGLKPQPTTVSDKVKNRLEQLDDFEEGSIKEMLNLTQQEYMNHIEELNQDLKASWEHDQRVKALKIAIQCSKLLVNVNVIHFYPSKFVLITDILDTFGKLVYQRILSMAHHKNRHFPTNFTLDQVPENAKATCRNWFFKIASIRELVPRFYVECALLQSHSFIYHKNYPQALLRLTKMIRGIGDPLVAAYARCYLCRVGMEIAPETEEYIGENFKDFLASFHQIQSIKVQQTLSSQHIELPIYLTLYTPALDWILQCVAYRGSEEDLSNILKKCTNHVSSALLINSIMSAFKPEFIANRSLELVGLMKDTEETAFPKPLLFRTLGLCLVLADPPEHHRLRVLNEVWRVVTRFKDHADYMSCAEVWIEYPAKHFSTNEVNTFLDDLIKHLMPDRAFEHHYPALVRVIDQIVSHQHDFGALFSMDKFLPFLDLLQKESVKVDACKIIMDTFVRHQSEPTNDPVIINAIMFICKTMHDSVNALTVDDEKRQISNFISGFIRKISFGRDFEQQLSFYVEARATFSNLESVLVELIQCVNLLSMKTRQIVKGHHTRKTSSFIKACAAYCFITIPSLVDIITRLDLYLLSGQVTLLNQCLSQADAFFKAAITLLPEMPSTLEMEGKPRSAENLQVGYISNFLSTLLVVPDHPDQEPLYLVRGLLNVIQSFGLDGDARCGLYLQVLQLLSALSQENYCYHVDRVESNDELYGVDPNFIEEINVLATTVLDEILTHLKNLGDKGYYKKQSQLALDLLTRVLSHGDVVSNSSLATLVLNLWGLSQKHGVTNAKQYSLPQHIIKSLLASSPNEAVYQHLAARLQLSTKV